MVNKIPLNIWWKACRPKTLTASIAPIIIATAMAYGDGVYHFPTAWICLLTAFSVQIGTNLANDYFDFKKGADNAERIGPMRVTQAGLIPPETVKKAFYVAFLITAVGFILLTLRGGWPFLILAILSILSGYFYTAGPKPLAYVGLGDLFVFIFFGPVAVAGTYYVQSFEMNSAVILAGCCPGLISMAILAVNNYRDIEGDRKVGKNTLAVRFGRAFAQWEFILCLHLAALIPIFIYYQIRDHILILTCAVMHLLYLPLIKTVLTTTDGAKLNGLLASTGKLLLVFSLIFAWGWIS